jgi:4-hydroxythreonine-4-phosphate dehydrogenase
MPSDRSCGALKPVIVTSGEPAGVGPDLCLALADNEFRCRLAIAGDPEILAHRCQELGKSVRIMTVTHDTVTPHIPGLLQVVPYTAPHPAVAGRLDVGNAGYVLELIRESARGCLSGHYAAMVTAPVQKSTLIESGAAFSGHTEYLAELTHSPRPLMLLVAGNLRVALATTHLPLRAVPDALTEESLVELLTILNAGLKERFGLVRPRIVVCGLNPHAGESGHLGREDIEVIAPAIRRAMQAGICARGPVPADTAFTPRQLNDADAVLAMYHDQGLPVLKYAGFGNAVNITLGLPIIRTSVDHGTALDLAGTGRADPSSLIAALQLAMTAARL